MNVMEIPVELGRRSYKVFVGRGLLGGVPVLLGGPAPRRAAVLSDSNVGPLYAGTVLKGLRDAGLETLYLEIPAGESSKTLERAYEIVRSLPGFGMTRADLLVALGGGVVGDLAGFAASIYKRGVRLVQVPTTLMSQVDSAIGGKTGVNLPEGKNLVGTFYQPSAVVADVETLMTLERREYLSGLAEVVKYTFLEAEGWPVTAERLPDVMSRLWDDECLEVMAKCAALKAAFVGADEFDEGVRSHLNYGHTLGHALETATCYSGGYTHGEAVSVGMVFAALVSESLGVAPGGLAEGHRERLVSFGLPVRPVGTPPRFETIMQAIEQDKKSRGDIAMVLLEGPGRPVLKTGIERSVLRASYRRLLSGG